MPAMTPSTSWRAWIQSVKTSFQRSLEDGVTGSSSAAAGAVTLSNLSHRDEKDAHAYGDPELIPKHDAPECDEEDPGVEGHVENAYEDVGSVINPPIRPNSEGSAEETAMIFRQEGFAAL